MAAADPGDRRLCELIEAGRGRGPGPRDRVHPGGHRAGRITAESGELLIDAAESEYCATVERLREQEKGRP